jgi:hypothetical protein
MSVEFKQEQLQDLGSQNLQPQSECVGWLDARQVDWTVFLFRKD